MKKTVLAVLLMVGLMFTQQAWAAQALDFNMGSNLGTISYAGGAAPLIGTGIVVDTVKDYYGDFTTMHSLQGGLLTFTTGASTTGLAPWNFGQGGSITLTGGIPELGITNGTTLMSGIFTGTPSVYIVGGDFRIFGAVFDDTKNQILADHFFGLDSDGYGYGWLGGINLSFSSNVSTPGAAFTSLRVGSGDIINSPKVPEPASMSLLGLGLLGFVGKVARRKFKA